MFQIPQSEEYKNVQQQLLAFKKQQQNNRQQRIDQQKFYRDIEQFVDKNLGCNTMQLSTSKVAQYKDQFKRQFHQFISKQNITKQSAQKWLQQLKNYITSKCKRYSQDIELIKEIYRTNENQYDPNQLYIGKQMRYEYLKNFFLNFLFVVNEFSKHYKFFKIDQIHSFKFPSEPGNKIGVFLNNDELALVTKFLGKLIIYPFSKKIYRSLQNQSLPLNQAFTSCQMSSFVFLLLFLSLQEPLSRTQLPQCICSWMQLHSMFQKTKQEGYKIVIYFIDKNPILAYTEFNYLLGQAKKNG